MRSNARAGLFWGGMFLLAIALVIAIGSPGHMFSFDPTSALPLLGVLGALATPSLDARQADYDKILAEAEALQRKYEGKRWDPADRKKFEDLCAEGAEIGEEIEAERKASSLFQQRERLRHVPEPTLPGGKGKGPVGRDIAGYVSLGDMIILAPAFQEFAGKGYPTGGHAVVQIIGAAMCGKNVIYGPRGEALVPLTAEQRKQVEAVFETKAVKAVPTLGAGVLDVDRVARVPQVTADDRLRIRDVISTGQTTAGSIEYVREEAVTGTPAPTAHGDPKPELAVEYTLQAAAVRTIAGWMPVQNQQMDDWPQLRSLIDGRLRYMVQRAEEQQVLWGNGSPPNLEGIFQVAGTQDIATNGRYDAGSHTLIDVIRLGITDVRVAGYEPNAVVLHPFDWETILLEKGTDNRYVWAVVTENNGSRIWGVRAVEAVGAQQVGTGVRKLVVGDFALAAQLVDRMESTIQIGLVNDQFIKNMRTILAEERVALVHYAPAGFATFETEAGS